MVWERTPYFAERDINVIDNKPDHIWMASCTSGLTHILTILRFWVFLKALTTSTKCLDHSYSVVQAKVCLRMLIFGDFHRAQNGPTLISDQVKKSEVDVSKNLKRKNGSLLNKQGEFYWISPTVHSRVTIHKKNVKKSHNNLKYMIKQINTN